MFGSLQNNSSKHVSSEYRTFMTGEKRDVDSDDWNTEKEHETTISFLARLNALIMTVLELLVTNENRGGTG